MNIKEFREKIDNDSGLISKRKSLVLICIIFLAINLSGATLTEANTFIFRIIFENNKGLSLMFVASIIFLTIRYYNYAQSYQALLFSFVALRMMSDYRVFYYDSRFGDVSGLLEGAINVHGGDEPGIEKASYRITGILQRALVYPSSGEDENGERYYTKNYINLNSFTNNWTFSLFLKILSIETRYRFQTIFKHREYLDILSPYFLSVLSILSFVFRGPINAFLQ